MDLDLVGIDVGEGVFDGGQLLVRLVIERRFVHRRDIAHFWVSMRRMASASDLDLDDGEPVEREGRETLLPSVTRSVLSTKSFVAESLDRTPPGLGSFSALHADLPDDPSEEPVTFVGRQRGARSGDVI